MFKWRKIITPATYFFAGVTMSDLKKISSLLAFLFLPLSLSAQESWNIEGRLGPLFADHNLGPIDLDEGGAISGTIAYRVTPRLAPYLGFGYYFFETDTPGTDGDLNVAETSFVLGLRFEDSFPSNTIGYRLQAGVTLGEIDLLDNDGDSIEDTDAEAGWEVGAAVIIELPLSMQLTPGIRYRSLAQDLVVNGVRTSVDLDYTAIEIGFGWNF